MALLAHQGHPGSAWPGGREGTPGPRTPQHAAPRGPRLLTTRRKLAPQTTPNLHGGAQEPSCRAERVGAPLRFPTQAGRGPTASGPQGALWARRGDPGTSERRLPGAHAHPRCGLASFFFFPFFFFFFFSGRPRRLRTGCGMGSEAPASGSGGAVRSSQGEAAAAAAAASL